MKRKILIALFIVLALSVSVLAGCNLDIMSIELKSGTLATEYYVGETVDLSKAKITVTKSDGTTEDIALTSSMLDKAISTAQAGETKYTVTYEGKTCEITIKVKAPTIALKAGTLTTEYYVGDEVSYTGAKLTVTEGEKTREVELTSAMVSPAITTAAAGKTTHTISYNGATTTVDVTVTAPTIALKEGTLKLEYLVGEAVSLEGAQITVTCGNRPVSNVALTSSMLDKAISTEAVGSTEYTISYNGATAKFTVIVRQVKSIDSVEGLEREPIKGESVVFTNAKLNVTYSDDTTGQVALTAAMLDKEITTSEAGKTTYTITYGGKTLDIEIDVQDIAVKSIAIAEDLDREYYIGYSYLDCSAKKLVVTSEDGTTRSIALSSAKFSPTFEETATVGNKEYTLTYEGKTTTLNFTVCDIELQLVDGFKKTYNVGEEIYVNGKLANSQIKVVAVNAAHTVLEEALDVTQEMVTTVFSTNTHGGDRELVISYKNKTLPVNDIVVEAITISLATGSDAMNTKFVKDSTVTYTGKLVITYVDNTSKTVDITAAMFGDSPISTANLGQKEYAVKYFDAETSVIVKVVPAEADKVTFTTWKMPSFIDNYTTKSGNINNDPLNGESTDFRMTAKYEVGNANKFLLAPEALNSGSDVEGQIWTNAKFEVKGEDNNYTELTGDALKEFVTIENNAYLFSNTAAGKTVKITVTVDTDYHNVNENIAPLTLEFVVVENGYNVYKQEGLAVMTDLIRPEIWAGILGCAVDANGEYVYLPDASKALRLEADAEPLFKYVGKVDWVVLHGDITIDPDKLPDAYFWSEGDEGYQTAYNTLTGAAYEAERKAMLNGSLKDWAAPSGDNNGNYMICKYNADDNNNKGLYSTNRANVSGNFSAITLSKVRSEGGRLLESVVYRHTHEASRKDEVGPQWHLFKMFVEKTPCGIVGEDGYQHAAMDYCNSPDKTFTLKNISLKGTTGLAGTSAAKEDGTGKGNISGGCAMLNTACATTNLTNVLAEGFNINFSADNYFGRSIYANIDSCRIVDSFSAAVFTWRGVIDVKNSYMKNFGGPAFIISDGDRRSSYDNLDTTLSPTVTLDQNSYAESYARGTEPWYAALDSSVTMLFGQLQVISNGFANNEYIRKSFFHDGRANVIAIMIPETGSVFEDQPTDGSSPIVITGKYTHNKQNMTVTASMTDPTFRQNVARGLIINSGSCYAYINAEGGLDADWTQWANPANLSDTITVWLNVKALMGMGNSPYIGIVIGDFTSVA